MSGHQQADGEFINRETASEGLTREQGIYPSARFRTPSKKYDPLFQ